MAPPPPPVVDPPKPRWICCCEYDPPSLRCGPCNRRDHNACLDKMRVR